MTWDENDVLEYMEGKVHEPPENAFVYLKSKYNKGEIKSKKIIIDSLLDHLIIYISKLNNSKEIYDKLFGMYEVNNLNRILSLKNQLNDINMNERDIVKSYFMRLSQLKDQFLTVGEYFSNKQLVLVSLGGLPRILETFITTISNNDEFPSFNELVDKGTQEDTKMISRGRIQKHEEGYTSAFYTQYKRRKEEGDHIIQEIMPLNPRSPIEE